MHSGYTVLGHCVNGHRTDLRATPIRRTGKLKLVLHVLKLKLKTHVLNLGNQGVSDTEWGGGVESVESRYTMMAVLQYFFELVQWHYWSVTIRTGPTEAQPL